MKQPESGLFRWRPFFMFLKSWQEIKEEEEEKYLLEAPTVDVRPSYVSSCLLFFHSVWFPSSPVDTWAHANESPVGRDDSVSPALCDGGRGDRRLRLLFHPSPHSVFFFFLTRKCLIIICLSVGRSKSPSPGGVGLVRGFSPPRTPNAHPQETGCHAFFQAPK